MSEDVWVSSIESSYNTIYGSSEVGPLRSTSIVLLVMPQALQAPSWHTLTAVYHPKLLLFMLPSSPFMAWLSVAVSIIDRTTTSFSEAESSVLKSGTDEKKAQYLRDRGVEIATFIDKFIQQNGLPPPDEKGSGGGFAILGWSLRALFALATTANVDVLGDSTRAHFARYMRSLILFGASEGDHASHAAVLDELLAETAFVSIGSLPPPKTWNSLLDESIPLPMRTPMINYWVSAYFDHGDLKTAISILSSTSSPRRRGFRAYTTCLPSSLRALYEKTVFDKKAREILPHMKVCALFGGRTSAVSLPSMFAMEGDDRAHGGGNICFRLIKGGNHFMHWDEPELTLETLLDAMA
ncbi:uncharacterized protein PHACADRAFT_188120 [Phanerochaete carnosa HHB-10118-sp]|uniref:AB hydrolase-1 domain-containing protein n=1 Tax=Phanerochaete carnosa (strain HHB-10118-sp) TaxID=650164 RepID=K5VVF8_PHACS|nr:uncharacterized protein PHACADRAFT_188120 [Phanerochaete carnosa HHB-10118-sp]EKM50559.1 hypothetical protein PHACADRAFT_188120 [Phanerochaete carnosa HHB-10118-sp]